MNLIKFNLKTQFKCCLIWSECKSGDIGRHIELDFMVVEIRGIKKTKN